MSKDDPSKSDLSLEPNIRKLNSQDKSRFMATAIHEIRTPIQTIIGTLELLAETPLDKEQTEYIRQLKFSSNVLLTLANDVLDMSKLQSGKFEIEVIPADCTKIAEQVVDLICIEAHNRGLEIITDIDYTIPRSILTDPTRLQQVILNLIKNAIKFTEKGFVCLSVKTTEDKKSLLFEIIDTGIGISKEKQEKIFNDYYQVDASTTRKYGGTGLGLAIAKNLIQRMHGKIGVRSGDKIGSVFWFSIPINEISTTKKKNTKQKTNNIKILLVDDHPLALSSLKKKLQYLGYINIDTTSKGERALSMMRSAAKKGDPYSIVFIDMIMPVLDGWRLSAEINSEKEINGASLFLMIPEGQLGGEAKMKMLDWFNGYLYKPIKIDMLDKLLKENENETVDLEIVEDEEEQKSKPTAVEIPISLNCKILVAEDHPINQKLLFTFLERFGATVLLANNGQEAIEIVEKNNDIDLIFMDIQMPVKTGVEATIEIRKKKYKGIIIACTANTDQCDFEEYSNAGMNDTLVKPFKKQEVHDLIEKWMPAIQFTNQSESSESLQNSNNTFSTDVEIWNYSDMLDTIDNDKKLAIQLIHQFIQQTRIFLLKAKQAIYQYNFQSLAKVAHTLKGSSAAISANALSLSAKKIETAAKTNKYEECRKHINEYSTIFSQFLELSNNKIEEWKE